MTEQQEPPTRLDSFKLTVRMDATISVNGGQEHWIKPGAEGAMGWKGYEWNGQWVDPIPTAEELKVSFQLIQSGVLAPVLEELIEQSLKQIQASRKGS